MWLCTTPCDFVQLHVALYNSYSLWLLTMLYDFVQLPMTSYNSLWPNTTLHGFLALPINLDNTLWLWTVLHDLGRLPMTSYDSKFEKDWKSDLLEIEWDREKLKRELVKVRREVNMSRNMFKTIHWSDRVVFPLSKYYIDMSCNGRLYAKLFKVTGSF